MPSTFSGLLFTETQPQLVLCKPKLLPLKSMTLQKLEQMQTEAKEQIRREQADAESDDQMTQAQKETFVSESVSFE